MTAAELATKTRDAYMAPDYGEAAWRECARFLFAEGFTADEAEWILRSKHMRWADDTEGAGRGNKTNSGALRRYFARYEGEIRRGLAEEAS